MLDAITFKEVIGLLTVALGIYGYVPYFLGIFRHQNKPHLFSWLIWSLLTGTGFAAQVSGNAGPGAWVMGVTAVCCLMIALLSLRYGEKEITRSDWIAMIGALSALPLWYFTKNPVASVLLISLIDALALYPTFRKTWVRPREEVLMTHAMSSVKFILSLLALREWNFVTVFYPASIAFFGIVFVITASIRRKTLNV